MSETELKAPPHSVEAEQSVIGGLLLDNARMADVADVVRADDFYRRDHRVIFAAMLTLDAAGRPFDVVTTAEQLQRERLLDEAGGFAYLGQLARETPTAANARSYATIVRDRAVRRRIRAAGAKLLALEGETGSTSELIATAQAAVLDAAGSAPGSEPEHAREGLTDWLESLDARSNRGDGMVGLSCGLKGLDDITAGLAPGDLIILAGRPSMGKTAFALNIAEHVGRGLAKPTLVFSLEQPRQQLLDRVMANLTGISHEHLRKGTLAEGDYPRVTAAMGQLQESQLYIDDSGSQTVVDLRAKARRVKHRHGLGLVIVDYLQLVDPVHRSDTRANDVSEISKGLKAMAKELGVPVIALAQLNRALEARDDKRPRVSDLRESGSIEQDADVIVFLYRHAAYDRMFLLPTVTELHIAKQRNGPLGVVYAHFFGEHMRFRDADRESVSHYQALMSAPKTRRRAMHPDDVPSGRERAQGRDA